MTKTSISLQDLRRRIYLKAKADRNWRFWGLYVHVCKTETLNEAYETARRNGGAAGIDGVTFEAIEEPDGERFWTASGANWSPGPMCPQGTDRLRYQRTAARSAPSGYRPSGTEWRREH